MGMMYKENRQYAAIPLTEITTQEGEQVSITLPDKSVVALNSLSSIKYAPQDFCKDNREIEFEGEAHYKVAKDARHPMSRELPTRQTVTPVRQERSECVWQLPAQVQPTW